MQKLEMNKRYCTNALIFFSTVIFLFDLIFLRGNIIISLIAFAVQIISIMLMKKEENEKLLFIVFSVAFIVPIVLNISHCAEYVQAAIDRQNEIREQYKATGRYLPKEKRREVSYAVSILIVGYVLPFLSALWAVFKQWKLIKKNL
jgi:hypothetical protein